MKLLRYIGLQKPANFDVAALAQAHGAEPEDDTVDGYIPFILAPSIDDSSDNSFDSANTVSKLWLGDEEINDAWWY